MDSVPALHDEVEWIEIAPHPARGNIYGYVAGYLTDGSVLVRWYSGEKSHEPLSAFGRLRPRHRLRLSGRKAPREWRSDGPRHR